MERDLQHGLETHLQAQLMQLKEAERKKLQEKRKEEKALEMERRRKRPLKLASTCISIWDQHPPLDQGSTSLCVIYAMANYISAGMWFKYEQHIVPQKLVRVLIDNIVKVDNEGLSVRKSMKAWNEKHGLISAAIFNEDENLSFHVELTEIRRITDFGEAVKEQTDRAELGESVIVVCLLHENDDSTHAMAAMHVVQSQDGSNAIVCRNSWGNSRPVVTVTQQMFVSAYSTEINVNATYLHEDGQVVETYIEETNYWLWHAAMYRKLLLKLHWLNYIYD